MTKKQAKQTKLDRDMFRAFYFHNLDSFFKLLDQGGNLSYICPDEGTSIFHLIWGKAPLEFIYHVHQRSSHPIDYLQKDRYGNLPSNYCWHYGDAIHCDVVKANVILSLENAIARKKNLPLIHNEIDLSSCSGTYKSQSVNGIFEAGFHEKLKLKTLYDFEKPNCIAYAYKNIKYITLSNPNTNLNHLTNVITKHQK